jgi:phosphoglycerate dehydrogenase-like enzyme
VPRDNADFHAGARWRRGIGRSLHGATLGVVGVGNVGSKVAAVGRAFDMDVVGWSRSLTDARAVERGIARAHTLAELLQASDVVTLHVTLAARCAASRT